MCLREKVKGPSSSWPKGKGENDSMWSSHCPGVGIALDKRSAASFLGKKKYSQRLRETKITRPKPEMAIDQVRNLFMKSTLPSKNTASVGNSLDALEQRELSIWTDQLFCNQGRPVQETVIFFGQSIELFLFFTRRRSFG